MLFQRSLLRELRTAAGGVFAVLLTTLVTMTLIRALGRAASGRIDGELVSPLIIFTTLNYMHSLLVLTIYIAVLLVLTRWWRDSEMVVWLSMGKSLTGFLKPVWAFIWPLFLITLALSFFVSPWADQQIRSYEEQIESKSELERISPGNFRESSAGERVFFLENLDDENGKIGTVFVRSAESGGRQTLLVSASGRFEKDRDGQQWVILERGQRTDLLGPQLESRTTKFDTYRVRIDPTVPIAKKHTSFRAMPMHELIQDMDARHFGELMMRINLPLLAIGLGFLAIPLAFVNVRSGRAVNLIVALLIYVIATNLLGSVKGAMVQGRLSFTEGVILMPLFLVTITILMFWWRSSQRRGPLEWVLAKIAQRRSVALEG